MIYIQKNNEGLPHHFDCACALYGATELGLDYKLVSFEEVQEGKYDNLILNHLFVGSVEFMTEVFNRKGISQPRLPLNNLSPFRKTLLRDFIYEEPVFIKPTKTKLFTGFVVDEYCVSLLDTMDGETEVIVQDVIPNIVSEIRCYIFRGKLVDIRQYSGDIYLQLQSVEGFYDNIKTKIEQHNFPDTFVMDLCFTKNNELHIIEFNDMWAIGNYGIPNDTYVRMLKERYFDIIKNKK